MSRYLIAPLFLLTALNCAAQFNRLDSTSTRFIRGVIEKEIKDQHIVGLSVGLVKNEEIVWLEGYGLEDRNTKKPATERTMYRLASVSKLITAILALQLYERGFLALDSNIRKLVPEYPVKPEGEITTRQLLAHTSGIKHYQEYSTIEVNNYSLNYTSYDPVKAIDVFKSGSLAFTPGTDYNYSTFGYNLLAAVVERAAQKPYTEQFRLALANPLKLPFVQPEFKWKKPFWNEASGYQVILDSVVIPSSDLADITWKLGGGGYIGTVIDLAELVKGVMKNSIFQSAATRSMMLSEQQINGYGTGYGLGLNIGSRRGKLLASHSGAQGKTSSLIYFLPNDGNGVVIMCNTEGVNLTSMAAKILDQLPFASLQGNSYKAIPTTPAGPQLLFPAHQQTNTGTDVVLNWTEEELAFSYEYEWADNSLFNWSKLRSRNSNTVTLSGLPKNKAIYWRARFYNPYLHDTTYSAWSIPFRFQTGINLSNEHPLKQNEFELVPISKNHFGIFGPKDFNVEIYSYDGRLIMRKKAGSVFNFSIGSEGMYLARCHTRNNTAVFKFLVQN